MWLNVCKCHPKQQDVAVPGNLIKAWRNVEESCNPINGPNSWRKNMWAEGGGGVVCRECWKVEPRNKHLSLCLQPCQGKEFFDHWHEYAVHPISLWVPQSSSSSLPLFWFHAHKQPLDYNLAFHVGFSNRREYADQSTWTSGPFGKGCPFCIWMHVCSGLYISQFIHPRGGRGAHSPSSHRACTQFCSSPLCLHLPQQWLRTKFHEAAIALQPWVHLIEKRALGPPLVLLCRSLPRTYLPFQKSGLCYWYSSHIPIPCRFLADVFIYVSNHVQTSQTRNNAFREWGGSWDESGKGSVSSRIGEGDQPLPGWVGLWNGCLDKFP